VRARKPFRHWLEYTAVRCVAFVVRQTPNALARVGGTALGDVLYRVDGKHRRIAADNLEQCFPEWSESERMQTVRRVFQHFGRCLVDLLQFDALSPNAMRARVEIEGAEHMHAAYAAGKGVLFFSGHFGCWEVPPVAHALLFAPGGVLARRLDNPRLHTLLENMRQRTGNVVIYREGAVRKTLGFLRNGQGVVLLIDQHTHSGDAITIQFFGRPAATTSTLAALALRTGAPVVPAFTVPLPGGRFRVIYEPAVEPPAIDSPNAVYEFTQRCTDVLERHVRQRPETWLWMHRRWREVPEGEAQSGDRS
jgi:Kdo2-lipid IVA lauroyltransferase/acyltransferase